MIGILLVPQRVGFFILVDQRFPNKMPGAKINFYQIFMFKKSKTQQNKWKQWPRDNLRNLRFLILKSAYGYEAIFIANVSDDASAGALDRSRRRLIFDITTTVTIPNASVKCWCWHSVWMVLSKIDVVSICSNISVNADSQCEQKINLTYSDSTGRCIQTHRYRSGTDRYIRRCWCSQRLRTEYTELWHTKIVLKINFIQS